MKLKILIMSAVALAFLSGCTKTETIVQQYNPPAATLYGTWQIINTNVNDSSKSYIIFPNDASNIYYQMNEDGFGFRSAPSSGIFNATDKQILIASGGLFNYTVSNDTLMLVQNANSKINLVKVKNPTFDQTNYVTKVAVNQTLPNPAGMGVHNYSIGSTSSFLYMMVNRFSSNRIYKYDIATQSMIDSAGSATAGSVFVKSGSTYLGFSNTNYIWKGNDLSSFSINSTNTLKDVKTLSINGTSNTIYAFQADQKMYTGTDGGAYSLLFDFSVYNTNSVVYHNNDAFLVLKNNVIYRLKISPKLTILNAYQLDSKYSSIYSLSSNGLDVWVQAYNTVNSKYEFLKVNIN